MEARELYKKKYEAQLHEWSAKLDVMMAQTDKLTAEAKLEMKPHVDAVQSKLEAAKAKLHGVAESTDDKWNTLVEGVDAAWTDLKASAEGAYDAMKRHEKRPGGPS